MSALQQMLLAMGGSNSLVSSIQAVTITIAAGATSGTASITSVDTTKSVERLIGWTYPANVGNGSVFMPAVALTAGNQITAYRNTSDASNALTVYAIVTQYNSSKINNIQRGSTALSSAQTSNTTSVTSVTTTNSAVQYNGCITAGTGLAITAYQCAAALTAATTITGSRGATGSVADTLYWTLAEFASGVLNSSTQSASFSVTGTGSATISSVATAQTMLWYGGNTSASGTGSWANNVYNTLASSTSISGVSANTPVGATTIKVTAVEYKSTDVQSVNRGTTTIASGTSQTDTTISAITIANTDLSHVGSTASATASLDPSKTYPYVSITSTTNVRVAINTAISGNTDTLGWEAIEHK